jgi:signal transduction histidine kinase
MMHKLYFCFFILTVCSCHNIDERTDVNLVSSEDSLYVNDSYKLVRKLIDKGEYDSALTKTKTYEEYSNKINFKKGIADACYQRGIIFSRLNELDSSDFYFKKAIEIRQHIADTIGAGKVFNQLAVNFKIRGNYDSALTYCRMSEDFFKISHDTSTLARTYNTYGSVYGEMNRHEEAMKYFLKKVKLDEMTGDSSSMVLTYENIAVIHQNLSNYREAIKLLEARINYCIEKEELSALDKTFRNLGSCFLQLNVFDSSLYYLKKGLALTQNLTPIVPYLLSDISGVHLSQENFDSAFVYAKAAFEISKKINNPRCLMTTHATLADVYLCKSRAENKYYNPQSAIEHYMEAGKIAKTQGDIEYIISSFKDLSKAYYKNNQAEKAITSFESYYHYKDSIDATDFSSKVAEMETKYETQRKENKILQLNSEKLLDAAKIAKQRTLNFSLTAIAALILISGFLIFRNVQKKRTAEKLVAILEKQNAIESMRSKIASDVHDDMGANLTRLGLNAQQLLTSPAVPEKEKQLAEKISTQSKEVITGMREIIWASNPANDNLKSMLGFMRQYIDRFFDGTNIRPVVNFPHDIGEITLHPEVRRNLFLILKESLHNAVKYSGSDKIDIDFSNENENFNLNIKDYGKGMDDKPKDDFSSGLRNMQMRAEQIQSLFKLITEPGKGVQIAIEGKLY